MTARNVAGWTLRTFVTLGDLGSPMLSGPADLTASVDDEGRLVIEGWGDGVRSVSVPLVAISALMNAHAEWLASSKGNEVT